jgi:hypothetical protein
MRMQMRFIMMITTGFFTKYTTDGQEAGLFLSVDRVIKRGVVVY